MMSGVFFFKQKTAYEMRISDWSSDVCSSDLAVLARQRAAERERQREQPWQRGLRAHGLRGVVRVEQDVGVQVAVAGVAEGDDRQVELARQRLDARDQRGKARHRHHHVLVDLADRKSTRLNSSH